MTEISINAQLWMNIFMKHQRTKISIYLLLREVIKDFFAEPLKKPFSYFCRVLTWH